MVSVAIRAGYSLELTVTQDSQQVDNNRTRARIVGKIVRAANYTGRFTDANCSASVTATGRGTIASKSFDGYDFRQYSTLTLINSLVWINHAADGTAQDITFTLRWDEGSPSGGLTDTTVSLTRDFTTIPRATTPSAGSVTLDNDGATLTISTPRASSGFTHTLSYSFGNASGAIASGVGTSYDWSVPASLLNQLPDSTSGTGTITCKTYSGSTLIGTKTDTFTVNVASSVKPSVGGITLSEFVSAVASNVGAYVQNQSRLNFAITGAAGIRGSTITAYKLTVDGATYSVASGTTGVIKSSGTVTATATVTDSRGRTASVSQNISVLAWQAPKVTQLKVERCLANGTLNDDGNYLKFTVTASVSSLTVSSTQKNKLEYRARTKLRTNTTWLSTAWTLHSGTSISASFVLEDDDYSELLSWDARFEARDLFATGAAQTIVGVGKVLLDIGKDNIGVGKRWEQGVLDVGGDIYQNSSLVLDRSDIATNGEAQAGASSTKVVSPAALAAVTASDTRAGLARLATQAEINGGTGGSLIVTPARLRNSANIPWAFAAGHINYTSSILDGDGVAFNVTFPSGRFSSAPIVTAVPKAASRLTVAVYDVTASGCKIRFDNFSGASASTVDGIDWMAVQMSSGSAAG